MTEFGKMQKENTNPSPEIHQYVGPYRLEKTLGKGQTGEEGVVLFFRGISVEARG